MASTYWIRLWHEILDDPKMGHLSHDLWRRAIELFLVAGELHQHGDLMTTPELAWRLRISNEEMTDALTALESVGIVSCYEDGIWHVVNFEKRQAPASARERKEQQRKRDHKAAYYGHNECHEVCHEDVTNCDTDQIRSDTDQIQIRSDTEADQKPPVAVAEETEQESLIRQLVGNEMDAGVAKNLVEDFPDRIQPALDYLRLRLKRGDGIKNPAGMLRRYVEDDWHPPPPGKQQRVLEPEDYALPPEVAGLMNEKIDAILAKRGEQ